MKKILISVLILSLLLSTCVFASEAKDVDKLRKEIDKEVRRKMESSVEYQMQVKECGIKQGEEMLNKIIETNLYIALNPSLLSLNTSNSPITRSDGSDGVMEIFDVENIQQTYNTHYCGPANGLQAIYGMGNESSVTGTTDAAKQDTLATDMETTEESGTIVWKLTRELNEYTPSNESYVYENADDMTKANFIAKIAGSIDKDMAPILHAKTQYLPYYNNVSYGHYLTLKKININTDEVTLCDTYSFKFGDHLVDIQDALDSIEIPEDRFFIYRSVTMP